MIAYDIHKKKYVHLRIWALRWYETSREPLGLVLSNAVSGEMDEGWMDRQSGPTNTLIGTLHKNLNTPKESEREIESERERERDRE